MEEIYFIGVDVGSGSVRAALVDEKGHVRSTSVKESLLWKPKVDFYEQSSNDIWNSCEYVIKVRKYLFFNKSFLKLVLTLHFFFKTPTLQLFLFVFSLYDFRMSFKELILRVLRALDLMPLAR